MPAALLCRLIRTYRSDAITILILVGGDSKMVITHAPTVIYSRRIDPNGATSRYCCDIVTVLWLMMCLGLSSNGAVTEAAQLGRDFKRALLPRGVDAARSSF
jgi:hypothetical protein